MNDLTEIYERNRQANLTRLNTWRNQLQLIHRKPFALVEPVGNPAVEAAGATEDKKAGQCIAGGAIEGTNPANDEGWAEVILANMNQASGIASTGNILIWLGWSQTKQNEMRVSEVMKGLGYTKKRATVNGVRDYFWMAD